MHVVVLSFDEVTERKIRMIWDGLSNKQLSDYHLQRIGKFPHLTVGTLSRESSIDVTIQQIRDITENLPLIEAYFDKIERFDHSDVIYLKPTTIPDISILHDELLSLGLIKLDIHEYYPHITLANHLGPKTDEVFEYLTNTYNVTRGSITAIKIMEITDNEDVIKATITLNSKYSGEITDDDE